ncbi:MAG: serine/threonine protein kinase [Myxococcales bacterium]|nr:serine/threonine protein kinase [Myxococcales bacterium]
MLEFEDPNELIGAVLDGRWRLSRVLGQGGLAVVFEGVGVDGTARAAIKVLRAEFGENQDVVARFLNEVQASARVDHPGIARVYEAVRAADGTPYLVMELLEGEPLADRMNRGRVPVEQASAIVQNILRALSAAHAAGVIHRDLKPGNVFLVGDSNHGSDIRVLDFGISLVLDAAGGMHRKTRTGMLLGTPGYMSPEQIKDIKHTDARADLWSCGILFYELLTGVPAFEAENDFVRVTKVLTSEPTPIQTVAPQYAHWAPFFQRALARKPEARFQTAYDMAQAVESVARSGQMPASVVAAPDTRDAVAIPSGPLPPGGHYPSAPPPHHPSAPPPGHYGSRPPPAPGAGDAPAVGRRFGGDTAVSAGLPGATSGHAAPSVEVVSVPRRTIAVPLPLALLVAVMALMLGFAAGLVVGKW